VTGGTPARGNPRYWGGTIPWIKTGEVNYDHIYNSEETITTAALEDSAAKLVPVDSILMAMYGQGPTLGRVAHLRIEAATNQACAAIFPSPKANTRYLYHYLTRQYSNIRMLARGASQPNINLQIVKDLVIPTAPLEEQALIAAELDAFIDARKNVESHVAQTKRQIFSIVDALFA
jgi:type I restriction enzyme S subunit